MTEVKASKDGTSYTIGRYIYDKLGRVARFVDGQVSGKSCTYGYDLTDRLCEAVFDDGTAYRYTYDVNDCLVKEVQTTPDGVRTVTRAYDADSRETTVICGSAKIEKTFDKLGRLSSIRRNGGKHTTTYTYGTAADGGQTGRISSIEHSNGEQSSVEGYGYDDWGNVSRISRGGKHAPSTFEYDAQGQLIKEVDQGQLSIFRYWYDGGGNLTEVRSYPVPESGEEEGDGTVVKKFAYDSTWKDQVTAVDGQTVAYDTAGNVTAYKGRKYSWCGNGILTDVIKEDGSQILGEKNASGYQSYIYNSGGEIEAIYYKKSVYYYIKNGQQDIIGLCDASGQWVVDYSYDTGAIF